MRDQLDRPLRDLRISVTDRCNLRCPYCMPRETFGPGFACTRARLSADGKLFTCLFASEGHDLRALVRGGFDDAELTERLDGIWSARRDRYSALRSAAGPSTGSGDSPKIEMSYIGG